MLTRGTAPVTPIYPYLGGWHNKWAKFLTPVHFSTFSKPNFWLNKIFKVSLSPNMNQGGEGVTDDCFSGNEEMMTNDDNL